MIYPVNDSDCSCSGRPDEWFGGAVRDEAGTTAWRSTDEALISAAILRKVLLWQSCYTAHVAGPLSTNAISGYGRPFA